MPSPRVRLAIAALAAAGALTVAQVASPPPTTEQQVVTASAASEPVIMGSEWFSSTTTPPPTTTTSTTAPPPPPPTTTAAAPPQHTHRSPTGGGDPNDPATWDRLAQCESGGDWHINTGNGYYGGIQFSLSSWRGVGGSGYPHEHSRETQIAMGQRLHSQGGWRHWPGCSRSFGWI